jgi:hypothetical protein
MKQHMLRLYLDASVFGGCHDPEFAEDSQRVIRMAVSGDSVLLVSGALFDELKMAPSIVRNELEQVPKENLEVIPLNDEIHNLAAAYIAAKVVTNKSLIDATHVAAATIARADAIVSWNFRHIVQLGKMKAYNAVNSANGYGFLAIVSPREVRNEKT